MFILNEGGLIPLQPVTFATKAAFQALLADRSSSPTIKLITQTLDVSYSLTENNQSPASRVGWPVGRSITSFSIGMA
jgi:hypothetical protein